LPPDLRPEVIGAGATQLGVALDEAQLARLAEFARLLARWNATHNLTAIRGVDDMLTHHLLDSLALVPHFVRVTAGEAAARVLDVGSGGGLPGIVLAIAAPQARVTLVDAVQKKCAFLTQARVELGLGNVEVVHGRVEALLVPPFHVIVSRALSTLAQFVAWTRHLLRPGGCWLAMKGALPTEELSELPPDVRAEIIPLEVPGLKQRRHLIEVRTA
jgi:16S rRNA (guanine527-N7)-methyltransferase